MDPLAIINKYYHPDEHSYKVLVTHSRLVARKALSLGGNTPGLGLDLAFVEEAAMLHDIGIFMTNAPRIGCYGEYPYICHGYLGAELLYKEGYPRHALVCERHTGAGLSAEMIRKQNLPLPEREMIPLSLEEQLICFADKFFSKSHPELEKSIENIRQEMAGYGTESLDRFDYWCNMFF